LIAVFVYLGFGIVPRAGVASPELYRSSYELSFKRKNLPVFIMRDDRSVVRHGTARIGGDGMIEVELFGSTRMTGASPMDALLFESGLPALWAAVSDSSQAELLRQIQ